MFGRLHTQKWLVNINDKQIEAEMHLNSCNLRDNIDLQ